MFHLRKLIKPNHLRSCSFSSPIIFTSVGAKVNESDVVNKVSFQLENGNRVGLSGSNEEGRDAIMQLLKGTVKPSEGFINFLQEKTVFSLNAPVPIADQRLTAEKYLSKSSSSSESINQALNNVELADLRLVRTVNTLSSSQIFRLKLATILLSKPNLILVEGDLQQLSYDDTQFLTKFLKSNSDENIVVINSKNEDFVQSVANTVIEIQSFDLPSTQYNETYAQAQTHIEDKKQHVRQTASAAIRAEILKKIEADATPEAVEQLNQVGYKNAAEAVSQEEYIRIMLIVMALHPPALIGLYSAGFFDAIL